ncbi:MAG TPA: hypothetical protein QGH10_02195, partial [Armatimonadota bacterium]|nr:hypothetical protein [Armatimonadota bacterium]
PTWAETRFMAYDAIVHGATGIVYWGASYEDQDAEIWESLRRIAGELSDLSPALVAEERVKISAGKASPVTAIGRRVGGKLWIIAVNESDQPIDAALRGARGVTGLDRFAEGDVPVRVRKGRVLDSFDPWEVHVYREP